MFLLYLCLLHLVLHYEKCRHKRSAVKIVATQYFVSLNLFVLVDYLLLILFCFRLAASAKSEITT